MQVSNAESVLCFAEGMLYSPCPHTLSSQLGAGERQLHESWGDQGCKGQKRFLSQFFCVHTSTSFPSDCFNDSYVREQGRCHWAKSGKMECDLSLPAGLPKEHACAIQLREIYDVALAALLSAIPIVFCFLSSHHPLGV